MNPRKWLMIWHVLSISTSLLGAALLFAIVNPWRQKLDRGDSVSDDEYDKQPEI
ncbi:MAG TPA: hypothetical protein VKM55_15500 [Candidatus Lokiarchaeia archaeon]|nr:hypothetical protein [Candidatus Lokiarchaeia archaeon]